MARPAIALEGKTRRGRRDRFAERKAAQGLHAWAGDSQRVLGQVLLEAADNDHAIQAAPRLIRERDLSGRLATLEARHLLNTP